MTHRRTGILGRITAIAYSDEQLYMVVDGSTLKSYKVVFYSAGVLFEARSADPVVDYYTGPIQSVAARGPAVYMLASDGRIFTKPETGVIATIGGANRMFCIGDSLLLVGTESGSWMQVDVANKIVGTPTYAQGVAFSDGLLHIITADAVDVLSVTPCPKDHFFSGGDCLPMPCVLACGPNSTRGAPAVSGGGCQCLPGFVSAAAAACTPCPPHHVCHAGVATRCGVGATAYNNSCVCTPSANSEVEIV